MEQKTNSILQNLDVRQPTVRIIDWLRHVLGCNEWQLLVLIIFAFVMTFLFGGVWQCYWQASTSGGRAWLRDLVIRKGIVP